MSDPSITYTKSRTAVEILDDAGAKLTGIGEDFAEFAVVAGLPINPWLSIDPAIQATLAQLRSLVARSEATIDLIPQE